VRGKVVFLGKAEGFSMTVLKRLCKRIRYKIDIFIWELAHKEK
jgi:hypothetical protein